MSGKLCGVCETIPFTPDCCVEVNGTRVKALRDSGASVTVVSVELVPPQNLTGEKLEIVLASSSEKRTLPLAKVELDTPYFKGECIVAVMQ